jgi:hypothetical protein
VDLYETIPADSEPVPPMNPIAEDTRMETSLPVVMADSSMNASVVKIDPTPSEALPQPEVTSTEVCINCSILYSYMIYITHYYS